MKAGSEPQSEQTYGDMAAANLRRWGWKIEVNQGPSQSGEETWIADARKGKRRIVVSAPDEGVALLEVERQAKLIAQAR